jgi:predicted molibdopterin-dependent oxidoreductase YjgC
MAVIATVEKTINLNIDGRQIKAAPDASILETAREAGVYIPTLCHHPRLSVVGSCRVCMVAVEGMKGVVPACATPVRESMVIKTDTPEVLAARRMAVELLLSTHPVDCADCDSNGKCQLQSLAVDLEVEEPRFGRSLEKKPVDERHPFLRHDPNKCILCGRCVRACREIAVNDVWCVNSRSSASHISTFFDQPMENSGCLSCGECVSLCPTGSLTTRLDKPLLSTGEIKVTRTTCPWCGVGCTIDLHTIGNKIVEVTSPPEAPANKGSLCVKGRYGYEFVNHPSRLIKPLIRIRPKGESTYHEETWQMDFREASWNEALNLVARKLAETKEKHGADSLAAFSSAKTTNEDNYVMQRFVRQVLGTNNIDHCARL